MSLYINNREYPNVINQLNSSWIKKYLNNEIKEDDIEKLEGLTSIKRYAFYRQSFTNITLPKSVVEINDHAFSDSLVSVKIPIDSNLKYIRDNAFDSCTKLKKINFPEGLIYIGDDAFQDNWALEKIILPESLEYIGNNAFEDCNKITEIIIPENVTHIGQYAFSSCDKITKIYYNAINCEDNTSYYGVFSRTTTTSPDAVIGDKVKILPRYIFGSHFSSNYASNCKSVSGGASLTSLIDYSFSYCVSLSEVNITGNISSIGSYAFRDCKALTKLAIGTKADTSLTIADNAFPTALDSHLDVYTDNRSIVDYAWTPTDITFYHLDGSPWEVA